MFLRSQTIPQPNLCHYKDEWNTVTRIKLLWSFQKLPLEAILQCADSFHLAYFTYRPRSLQTCRASFPPLSNTIYIPPSIISCLLSCTILFLYLLFSLTAKDASKSGLSPPRLIFACHKNIFSLFRHLVTNKKLQKMHDEELHKS